MWNRCFTLTGDGLLQAVENGGKNILAGRMRLTGKIDGETIDLVPENQEVIEQTFDMARFRSQSKHGNAVVAITTLIENDGMMQ